MQKPRAHIINFENNRNINKSIVFDSLLIHYSFATWILRVPWGCDGEALKLSCCKDITNYVLPSLTDVVLVSLYGIIILFINRFTTAK